MVGSLAPFARQPVSPPVQFSSSSSSTSLSTLRRRRSYGSHGHYWLYSYLPLFLVHGLLAVKSPPSHHHPTRWMPRCRPSTSYYYYSNYFPNGTRGESRRMWKAVDVSVVWFFPLFFIASRGSFWSSGRLPCPPWLSSQNCTNVLAHSIPTTNLNDNCVWTKTNGSKASTCTIRICCHRLSWPCRSFALNLNEGIVV